MSSLKFFLLTFFMLNLTLMSFASAQYNRPSRPLPGRLPEHRPLPPHYPAPLPRYEEPRRLPPRYPQGHITCSAQDKGWEEHWSGHRSCGECVRHHGKCVETCQELRELCEVQGQDYYGRIRIYRAVSADRRSAEYEAIRQCQWDRDNRSCSIVSCRSDNRTISTRSCR